jgi:hypothetical protein
MSFFVFDTERIDTVVRMSRKIVRLSLIVLCEGGDDIDALEALVKKISIQLPPYAGISDCGGIDRLKDFAPIVATLCRHSKKIRKIVIILDTDKYTVPERAEQLNQILNRHGVILENLQPLGTSIYQATSGNIEFLIMPVGDMQLPFERHEMEDYAINLLLLKGDIEENQIEDYSKPSDFIEDYGRKAPQIIEEANQSQVQETYEDVIDLLNRFT